MASERQFESIKMSHWNVGGHIWNVNSYQYLCRCVVWKKADSNGRNAERSTLKTSHIFCGNHNNVIRYYALYNPNIKNQVSEWKPQKAKPKPNFRLFVFFFFLDLIFWFCLSCLHCSCACPCPFPMTLSIYIFFFKQ